MMVMVLHGYEAFSGWIHRPSFLSTDNTYLQANFIGQHLEQLIRNFSLGVDFFFLISGFLITYLLLIEKEKTGSVHIGKFYLRRVLRIWPLYFFIVLSAPFIVSITSMPEPIYQWTALLLNNFQAIFYSGIYENGLPVASQYPFMHFWSVCVEEHFYLFWPLVMAWTPVKKLPWMFAGIILISFAFRGYIFLNSPQSAEHLNWNTIAKIDTLSIGGWLAWIHFRKPIQWRIPQLARTAFFILASGILIFTNSKDYGSIWEALFRNYLYTAIFVFILISYLFDEGAWFQFRKKNFLHYLGKISFGIYIYHNILYLFIIKLIIFRFDLRSLPLFCLLYLVTVIGMAALSYRVLEKPFLKLKDKFALIDTSR